MRGHLGSRASALLDGQLPRAEEDRAWSHVHGCHQCRDLVEREGWVKTRLAGLARNSSLPSGGLKGSLLAASGVLSPADTFLVSAPRGRGRGMVALGGGALGVAVVGLLALGTAPATAPVVDRRGPVTSVVWPTDASRTPVPTPVRVGAPSRHGSSSPTPEPVRVTMPW